jgi:hypothetical protein
MIDVKTGLQWMQVPDAEGIANRLQAEQAMAILQAQSQKQGGK